MGERTYCFDDTLNKESVGYVVNIECSQGFHDAVAEIRNAFHKEFGDAVYLPGQGAMHITVYDFMTTLESYDRDVDEYYRSMSEELDSAISHSIESIQPFTLSFNVLELFQPCIIAKAKYSSELAIIRNKFLDVMELFPQTKRPPNIVHSTIIAFREKVPFEQVHDLFSGYTLSWEESVQSLRLMRETKIRGQAQELVCEYTLASKKNS
ncbi:hypothetical protein COW46_00920 [Candidatus Gracilibacteria bacterium CG17_big_fil_post_rev_8_21_14_2_50_48_13]|nr:MAG: hypothetical protein COW46_00920 [Candidatus Gracilibacteria bacterium CG17_big_fil_post_rev_8_21_14_2_50_48_13]